MLRQFQSKFLLAGLSLVAFAAIGGSAYASVPSEPQTSVRYSDLNFSSSADREIMAKRIANAARVVCGDPDGRAIEDVKRNQDCRAQAVERANRELAAKTGATTLD